MIDKPVKREPDKAKTIVDRLKDVPDDKKIIQDRKKN